MDRQFLRLLLIVGSVYGLWQMNIKVVSNVLIQTFSAINLTIKVELLNLIFLINPKYLLISFTDLTKKNRAVQICVYNCLNACINNCIDLQIILQLCFNSDLSVSG